MKLYLENYVQHATYKRQLPYWKRLGVRIVREISQADIHLVNVKTAGPIGKPIVQRLDGIYYDSDTPYKQRNKTISATHRVASGIIYQSEYCKDAGEFYLEKRRGPYRVIYNGIKQGWTGKRRPYPYPTIVVSAKWRRHKRLPETVKLFRDFRKTHPKAVLYIMGDLVGGKNPTEKNVIHLGHISHKEMRQYFRNSWFSLHLSKRDACPNSTVEAIGAGVPVITTNACGGGTEMCEMTEGCVIVDGDDYTIKPVPHYRDEYNELSESLHNSILEAMLEITETRPTVELPKQLTAGYMAAQYVDFMESLM